MDNITILILSVVSQWVVMCFPEFKGLLTYGVNSCVPCLRYLRDVFGGVKSVTIVQRCQEVNINLCVLYLDNISDKQKYDIFWIPIYSDHHLSWLFCVLI